MTSKKLKVVVSYRVLQHWRVPVFEQLSQKFNLIVLHGESISGTKLINGKNIVSIQHEELKTFVFKFRTSGRNSVVPLCPTLLFHLFRQRPNVILAEGGSNLLNNFFVFAYGGLFRVPIVWWTLGELPGRQYSALGKLYRRFVVMFERRATCLIGYSSVAMKYFNRMGYEQSKTFKAVNCVDTDRILGAEPSLDRIQELRIELGITRGLTVLFVGALMPEKRVDRLITAFKQVSQKISGARLVIVGDGTEQNALQELVSSEGLSDVVLFPGKVIDGVGNYFSVADVFVLPGLGGLAISEALAYGLPVICTVGDGCEVDLVIDGVTGFRIIEECEGNYPSSFAAKMEELLINSELRSRISRNARQHIEEKVNIGRYVECVSLAVQSAYKIK